MTALGLAVTLGAASMLSGCSTFNFNLGRVAAQASTIFFIAPSGKSAGCPGFTLEVTGFGFVEGATVQWNGSDRPTTFDTDEVLLASISDTDIAQEGTALVNVRTPGTTEGNDLSNFRSFTIGPPAEGSCPEGAAITTSEQASVAEPSADDYSPAISVDRRFVAFVSVSPDPSADASTGLTKVYLRDTCEGVSSDCMPATILISAGVDGSEPNGSSSSPTISADGRLVAFASDAGNLVFDDTNGVTDVFVADTCIGASADCAPATTRVSLSSGGAEGNGASDSPSISADGRFVAFNSTARNLVLDGSSAPSGAFLRDTCFGAADDCAPATTRIAISPAPSP